MPAIVHKIVVHVHYLFEVAANMQRIRRHEEFMVF